MVGSGSRPNLVVKQLDLNILDTSITMNLEEELNKKSVRGHFFNDLDYIPHFEEGKYTISDETIREAHETGNLTMYGDTSEVLEPNIPQLNFPKINELGNYNAKYRHFFEEFYIIGVDSLTLESLNQSKVVLRPSLLKNYPNKAEHKERHDVIKDF